MMIDGCKIDSSLSKKKRWGFDIRIVLEAGLRDRIKKKIRCWINMTEDQKLGDPDFYVL